MRRFHSIWLAVCLSWLLGGNPSADEFKQANGNILRGEVASADEDGLVVKLDVGGFSKREPWINFSQETLKELAKDPKVTPLVEPFIELEPEQIKAREKQKEITVKPVPNRLERPAAKPGLVRSPGFSGPGIEVELWELGRDAFGSFVAGVPAPMVIGNVTLDDGRVVKSFLCETYALEGSEEITSFGGFRAFLAKRSGDR